MIHKLKMGPTIAVLASSGKSKLMRQATSVPFSFFFSKFVGKMRKGAKPKVESTDKTSAPVAYLFNETYTRKLGICIKHRTGVKAIGCSVYSCL